MQLQLAERFGGMDKWGAQIIDPHYGAAWAWAGNTPFSGASRSARTWGHAEPDGGPLAGSHRGRRWIASQFGHVIDSRRRSSTSRASRSRRRSTGSSRSRCTEQLRLTFADANAPEFRTQQYFETIGNRGMYKYGWWLAMKTERIPWVITPEALKP